MGYTGCLRFHHQGAVFSWVPGTDLAEHLSPANLYKMGELMARLHQHALTYRPPAGLELLHYARVFPFPEPVILFEPCFAHLFPPERQAVFKQAIHWAQTAIDRLQATGEPMRILHNDLHQWNVRIWRGRLSPIDFEDLMWGWPTSSSTTRTRAGRSRHLSSSSGSKGAYAG